MAIWSAEIKELQKLYESFKGRFPELEKELGHLIKTDDENVVLLYSRRCLEVIITDLCECELSRPRKTEPLKGIIDKLQHDEKIPSHIITSMHNLNSLSTYGAHPKDFDLEQVKPVLVNLNIIIKWYLKYKDKQAISLPKTEKAIYEPLISDGTIGKIQKPNKKLIFLLSGLTLVVAIVVVALFVFNIIGGVNQIKVPEKSIAVLPFISLSTDPEKQYQADGMMDAITLHLSKIRDLRVLGRTSTEQYRNPTKTLNEIGKELDVSYLLEGSFQKFGDSVRLIVQLIRTGEEGHIWADNYDRLWNNIFSVQSEVAQSIAKELNAAITPKEQQLIEKVPTSDLTAYDYYLRGNDYMNRSSMVEEDIRHAIQMYEKAIEVDPEFALAYTGLAFCHRSIFYYFGKNEEEILIEKRYLDKAMELAPNQKEVRIEEARYLSILGNRVKALQKLEKLSDEYPNDDEIYAWLGYNYRSMGELRKSLECSEKAKSLNPSNWSYWFNEAFTHQTLRDYDKSETDFNQAIDLNPSNKGSYVRFFDLYVQTGQIQEAENFLEVNEENFENQDFKRFQAEILTMKRQYEQAKSILQTLTEEAYIHQGYYYTKYMQLGLLCRLMSDNNMAVKYFEIERDKLIERISEFKNDHRLYRSLGIAYAGLGMKEEALDAGRKALDILSFEISVHHAAMVEMDMARIMLMVGEQDEAVDRLEKIIKLNGWLTADFLKIDPFWDPVRDNEKFKEIINNPAYQVNL